MFKSIKNIGIFPRIFTLFVLLTLIPSIVIALLGVFFLNTTNLHAQSVKTSFEAQQIATEQQISLQRMNALLQARFAQIFATGNYPLLHNDPSLAASGALIESDIAARELTFAQTLTSYQQNYEVATAENMSQIRTVLKGEAQNSHLINDQQTALEAVINTDWGAYKVLQDKALADLQAENPLYEPAYKTLYLANEKFLNLQKDWQTVVDAATSIGQAVTAVGSAETQPIIISTAVALLIVLLIIIATGYIVNATITNPLRQLATLTRRIASGDTSARAPIEGHDEIYTVATSMNTMLDNIVRLIQEAQARHSELQTQVEKLINEVSGVGEGDLRIQAEVTTDSLGVLADSFNYMVEELSSLVVNVKTMAHEVGKATIQSSNRMNRLVEVADGQIQQIATAAIKVEDMATASRRTAEHAQVLYQVANKTYQTARSGRYAVHQTVEGIGRINEHVRSTASRVQMLGERSNEINNIVRVISGIAQQTNRLALDAAIQAAMAGANGKGFGAVAEDIRRLAEIAKTQTIMIERIVRTVHEEIETVASAMQETENEAANGAQLTQEAGSAFESIYTAVEGQVQEIETINQSTRQQLQISSAVVQIMQSVAASTRQGSMSIHEEAQLLETITRLAEQLLASVEVFKLREEPDMYLLNGKSSILAEPAQHRQPSISGTHHVIPGSPIPVQSEYSPAGTPAGSRQYNPATPPYQISGPNPGSRAGQLRSGAGQQQEEAQQQRARERSNRRSR